ncbi:MAG: hypothetical protein FJX48_04370 [Alphaproteobacteria bacterium]|nr:hypothetical protein [Alphaproteobacteria bacterium]
MAFDSLGAPTGVTLIDLPKTRRFACRECGVKEVQVLLDWPPYRPQRERQPDVDLTHHFGSRGQLTQRRADLIFKRRLEIGGEKNEQAPEDRFVRDSLRSVFLCCDYAGFGGTNESLAPAGRFWVDVLRPEDRQN